MNTFRTIPVPSADVNPIETERLLLIPMNHSLVQALLNRQFDALEQLGIHTDLGWPSEDLYGLLELFVKELTPNEAPHGFLGWIIADKLSLSALGDIGFKGKADSQGIVEMGYGIVPKAQNNGYCTEAGRAIMAWVCGVPEVRVIKADCLLDNVGSIKVLEKLGFRVTNREDLLIYWEYHCN